MAPTNRTREAPGEVRSLASGHAGERSLDSGAGGRARENDHRRVSSGERLNVHSEPGKLRTALARRGVRLTRQRRILLDIMDQAEEHLTADSILERAQKIDPRVHRVTVYRTLEMLKSHGLLDELDLLHIHGHRHYYESHGPRDHIHVACLRCGKVREVESELFEQLKRQVERDTGIGITVARVEIGGYCENCRPKDAT